MMNYTQALSFLDETATLGSSYGLDSIRELLSRVGNPQESLKFIHIAGTNGKGSVLAYSGSVLGQSGYKTGSYLSPALITYRERIQINGSYISQQDVARLVSRIAPICLAMQKEGYQHPTYFEISLAIALLYFAQEQCDIVILEVGLGGRLDATNIISSPLCCGIVSISLDHTALLGNTLPEIAAEKAGIIKDGTTVICAPQSEDVADVFRNVCKEHNAAFTMIDRKHITSVRNDKSGQVFHYRQYQNLQIPLLGIHQLDNVAIAIEILDCLRQKGWSISDQALRQGLASTVWPGRFQRIAENPDIILDGAHNPDAALRLKDAILTYYPSQRRIFVLSILADKDFSEMIRITAPLGDLLIATTTSNPRALSAEDLADHLKKVNEQVVTIPNLTEAIDYAQTIAQKEDCIFIFGSLSHLGEAYEYISHTKEEA